MSWSNGSPDFAARSNSRLFSIVVLPTVRMSATCPFMCWEPAAPPTKRLSRAQRYPLVTMMGAPHSSRRGSSTLSTRAVRFSFSSPFGRLGIPLRLAVAERVSSSMVKCFMMVYFFIFTFSFSEAEVPATH